MKDFDHWMVGLDLTDHDYHLIEYTHHLSRRFSPKKIVFVHIKRRENIPETFRVKLEFTREELLSMVEERVYDIFAKRKEVLCEIHEGTPYFDIWRESHLHHTDLVILGEKHSDHGRKIVPEKFARKSFCSVLLVPLDARHPKHIWVPVDFSSNSKMAVQVALQFYKKDEARVTCQNVYETPSLSQIQEDKKEEYLSFCREETQKEMDKFLAGIKNASHVESHLTKWLFAHASDHIKQDAQDQEADLIVMSSGGKSRISTLLLGSTTSELIKLEKNIPLLVLKERIDRVRSWDILTNL